MRPGGYIVDKKSIMAKAIFLAPTGPGAGLTSVALGLVHALDRRGVPVGFYKPVTQLHVTDTGPERSTALARHIAHLEPPEPLAEREAQEMLAQEREDELLERIVARYERAAENVSIVVVEGLVPRRDEGFLTALNTKIARGLDADTVIVTAPGNSSLEQLQELLELAIQPYGGVNHERLPGCILNLVGAPVDQAGRLRFEYVGEEAGGDSDAAGQPLNYTACPVFRTDKFQMLGCIPWRRDLMALRVKDILRFNHAETLHEGDLDRRVRHVTVIARSLANFCDYLRSGALIITPGDRDDVLLAACMAALNGIPIAGLVLTGGLRPSPSVWDLCRAGLATGLPVAFALLLITPVGAVLFWNGEAGL